MCCLNLIILKNDATEHTTDNECQSNAAKHRIFEYSGVYITAPLTATTKIMYKWISATFIYWTRTCSRSLDAFQ